MPHTEEQISAKKLLENEEDQYDRYNAERLP